MLRLSALCIMFVVSGCVHSARVQMDYIAKRDECRDMAEQNQQFYNTGRGGNPTSALAQKDRNAVLAKIFSDCMYVNGWTVATPPTAGDPPRPPQDPQYAKAPDDDLEYLSTPSRSSSSGYRLPPDAQQGAAQPAARPSNTYVPASPPLPARMRKPVNAPRR